MLTGDLNTASVEWTVQWKVTEPSQFLFRFPLDENDRFAENLLTTVARTVMNQMVGDYSFDEVIGAKRSDIAFKARDGLPADPRRLCLRHHGDGPPDAAGDPARAGQAGVR